MRRYWTLRTNDVMMMQDVIMKGRGNGGISVRGGVVGVGGGSGGVGGSEGGRTGTGGSDEETCHQGSDDQQILELTGDCTLASGVNLRPLTCWLRRGTLLFCKNIELI